MAPPKKLFIYFTKHTLKPPDLCGMTVSLLRLATILKMMAGLLMQFRWAEASLTAFTIHVGARQLSPELFWFTLAAALRTAVKTEYSVIFPTVRRRCSQERWTPSVLCKSHSKRKYRFKANIRTEKKNNERNRKQMIEGKKKYF